MKRTHTRDERLYTVGEQLRADIPVTIPAQCEGEPTIQECRYAVLPLANGGWVTYDRVLSRVVNGVWFINFENALDSARHYNTDPEAPADMNPSGAPLGLIFPDPPTFL